MTITLQRPNLPSTNRAATGKAVGETLEANPAVTKIKLDTAQVYYHQDFVSDDECKRLCQLIDRGRRPSTLLSETSDPYFRTSESCDMDRFSPLIQPIDERIADLLGIDRRHGETMQGQRYAPGQQFRAHHDYFLETMPYWPRMETEGGQRTWTAMVYLNEVQGRRRDLVPASRHQGSGAQTDAADLEQYEPRRQPQPTHAPRGHGGGEGHQIRHDQVVSRRLLDEVSGRALADRLIAPKLVIRPLCET